MAAPKFAPGSVPDGQRFYESPDYVPDGWEADRPGELVGRQPRGPRLGYQGPDQGYALALAARVRPKLVLSDTERADDALTGCTAVAMRRASMFGRAPVIHDLTVAFTVWGFLDESPAPELVDARRLLFAEVRHAVHYPQQRAIVDAVPESTLRMLPAAVAEAHRADWRSLLDLA